MKVPNIQSRHVGIQQCIDKVLCLHIGISCQPSTLLTSDFYLHVIFIIQTLLTILSIKRIQATISRQYYYQLPKLCLQLYGISWFEYIAELIEVFCIFQYESLTVIMLHFASQKVQIIMWSQESISLHNGIAYQSRCLFQCYNPSIEF